MTMQLRKLYECVPPDDMRLIAGHKGINNSVRWMHMVESLEISSFLSGQELAFITGIGLSQPGANSLLELVRGIYENNPSAVVVNVGPYIAYIPQEVIDFCDEHGLPLFEVPWRIHLAEIMHLFGSKIAEAEMNEVELVSAMKHAITDPRQEDLYLPTFKRKGFLETMKYCVGMIEILDENSSLIKNDAPVMEQVKISLENMLIGLNCSGFALLFQDHIVCVFADCRADVIKKTMLTLRTQSLLKLPAKYRFRMGIGGEVLSPQKLVKSYEQVKKIIRLQAQKNSNELCIYDEQDVYSLLFAVEDNEVMADYLEKQLGPLIKSDDLKGTNYVEVLQIYLETNGSVNQTAAQLFVHRNTVNYKLGKIEELLSCDLSEFYQRVKLQLALMVYRLLKK